MKAKEMFEKLGYKFSVLGDYIIYKHEKGEKRVVFDIPMKTYNANAGIYSMHVNVKELKAINKQCEELGWL